MTSGIKDNGSDFGGYWLAASGMGDAAGYEDATKAKSGLRAHMRPPYKRHLLVAGLLCSAAIAGAQQAQSTSSLSAVPRLLHFAGLFHPPGNHQVDLVGATFAIYGEQEGGTPLWSEDQNVGLDANGNYTVLLGLTKNAGVPVELFVAGEARWLQVKFYLPDEVLLPRVLLVSVPYALKAADAETVGGLPPSAFMLAVQPTDGAAGATSHSRTMAPPAQELSSSGTTEPVSPWLDNSGSPDKSVLFQSGTASTAKVGINTATPASTLGAKGSAPVRGTLSLRATGSAKASEGKNSQPLSVVACASTPGPGNTIGKYRQQCQDGNGAIFACDNSAECAVTADWAVQNGGSATRRFTVTFLLCAGPCVANETTNWKWTAPISMTFTRCTIDAVTYPTGAAITVDLLKAGTITIFSSRVPTLAAGSRAYSTQTGMAAAATFSVGDYVIAKVLTVGSTIAGQFVNLVCTATY